MAINPGTVASPAQVRAILAQVERVRPELVAFFGCLYYAALRPEEAVALHRDGLSLPADDRATIVLTSACPRTGTAWTSTGTPHEPRGLKHRPDGTIRVVPVLPVLADMLCRHLRDHGTAPDGRLFRGARGGMLSESVYGRVWHAARQAALGPELVAWDRWAADNHNSVTLAASGAGKSYLAKLEILRSLYQGTECWVIDPEDEYARLAAATGGAYIHLGAAGVHLNPFDLPAAGRARPDTLTRRALFLHTLIAVLLGGQPVPAERAALDKAIMAAYHQAGITADPRTWNRPAPLLAALAAALRGSKEPAALTLAGRLAPFTEGSHAGLFAAPTTTRPEGHLVVFSLRDVPDELRPVATLLALDATWRQVSDPANRRRRLITVDEAWLLMRNGEGAKFIYRMAKAARKAWAGLAAVTQDAEDVLGSDLGRAVIANSATQILLRQAPQAIGQVASEFRLSAGERALLLSARRGEGLLAGGPSTRVSFQALASPAEHFLCTSDPAEIARLEVGQCFAIDPRYSTLTNLTPRL